MAMEYVHPQKYKGIKFDTPNAQARMKLYVEENCLKCDLFMGKEHDFAECNHTLFSLDCTCPQECRRPPAWGDPYSFIKCKSEGEER